MGGRPGCVAADPVGGTRSETAIPEEPTQKQQKLEMKGDQFIQRMNLRRLISEE
ncbi:hypothetical protein NG791_27890 [Laspinema sp. D1]|nr:hypothetical protein [Laspinema sp. D2b]